jgi:transcription initiation factor TFIIH subunit 1
VIPDGAPQAGNYMLTFTSATARDDQQATTGLLRKWIEASKAQAAPTPAPARGTGDAGASAAVTMAQTVTAAAAGTPDSYDDATLLGDLALQHSLLQTSPALRLRFDRAMAEKPDSVTLGQFSQQFWSTRVHMLRSHTTERSQATGTYNVLSVIKSKTVNGALTLSLTKEQIELLFRQHPVVQKAYNENVPQLSEMDFWERFFHSRLMKKLKGERIQDKDVLDPKLDKYLQYDEAVEASKLMDSIPMFLNIEGNEQNHSQKQGNRPDFTMNPSNNEKAPILRVLNRMSEKMLKDMPPSDASRHGPVGMDEETYKELQLRDLQRADDDNRVVLNVQDQSRLFSAGQSVHASTSAASYSKRTPAQALSILHKDLEAISTNPTQAAGVDFQATLGIDDDSSSEEEDAAPKKAKIGSKTSRTAATSQIVSAIKKRHMHDDDYSGSKTIAISEQARKLVVSEQILQNLIMTHNTTVEFLHYFWAVFHSGDPERANEVAKLIETLDKCLDRVRAVADAAESERAINVDKYKREVEAFNQRSSKKRRYDPGAVKGGAKAINQVVQPLLRAINAARSQYQKALHEQLGVSANGT